jgi:molybdopterin-guanine dinucleotide biosynthesis protein A
MQNETILGVILAGGKSTRMGQDKASLNYNGLTFLDNAIQSLNTAGINNIAISGAREGYECIADLISDAGPAVGVCSVAKAYQHSHYKRLLVVAVDMPLCDEKPLKILLKHKDARALAFKDNPLPCLLGIDALNNQFTDIDKLKNTSLAKMLAALKVEYLAWNPEDANFFYNVNKPEDLNNINVGSFQE